MKQYIIYFFLCKIYIIMYIKIWKKKKIYPYYRFAIFLLQGVQIAHHREFSTILFSEMVSPPAFCY